MDLKNKGANLILARGLLSAETIAQELRERLVIRLGREWRYMDLGTLLTVAREVLDEFEPLLARAMFDTDLAAWITGADFVVGKLPAAAVTELVVQSDLFGGDSIPPIDVRNILFPDDEPPIVRWPVIEKAAQSLSELNVVTKEDFDQLSYDLKSKAFTAADISSVDTLEHMRDTLVDLVREGPALRQFKERIAESLETSPIGPHRIEAIYRNNVQAAYSAGNDYVAHHPVVSDVFPYREVLPIHDARARPHHRELEKLGIDGTGIYRVDDTAFWDLFLAPFEWNCRCGSNLMTIEKAASKGVREAQQWADTGEKPPLQSRLPHIPFRPDPAFVRRGGVLA